MALVRGRWHRAQLALLLVAALGPGSVSGAECLADGAEAQRAGRLERAEVIFRQALADPACQTSFVRPLVRFSLAQVLLGQPMETQRGRSCEAATQLQLAVDETEDADIRSAAAERLVVARARCAEAATAAVQGLPVGPRLRFGPRVEAGISGLLSGRFASGEVEPGPVLGLGLAAEYHIWPSLRLLVEPGVAITSLRYHRDTGDRASVVWGLALVEVTAGIGWQPLDTPLGLVLGLRGGRVVHASERSGLIEGGGVPIDVNEGAADGVFGLDYTWLVGRRTRLRATLALGLGILRLNAKADAIGWHGYRLAAGAAALF